MSFLIEEQRAEEAEAEAESLPPFSFAKLLHATRQQNTTG